MAIRFDLFVARPVNNSLAGRESFIWNPGPVPAIVSFTAFVRTVADLPLASWPSLVSFAKGPQASDCGGLFRPLLREEGAPAHIILNDLDSSPSSASRHRRIPAPHRAAVRRPRKSVAALEAAMATDKELFLVAQLDPGEDDPDRDALYDLGVIATAMQLLKLPDGTVRVLVEGVKRATPRQSSRATATSPPRSRKSRKRMPRAEAQALMRSVVDQFENYAKLNKRLPPETGIQLGEIEDPSVLADAVASNLSIKVADKQALARRAQPGARLEMVFAFMEGELGVLQVEKKIRSRVKRQMEKTQREYYLNEQLKAIQRELGNESEEGGDELQELAEKIRKTRLSKEARKAAPTPSSRSFARWRRCRPKRPSRATISTSCSACPGARSPSSRRTSPRRRRPRRGPLRPGEGQGADRRISRGPGAHQQAQGPDPVPRRPSRRRQDLARPLDRRATGREFVRQSLGGVRDEAEIRGHRRTYIGSLPGKIIANIKRPGRPTRCSCSTRSTSSARTSAAIRPRRYSRCSIRSRTASSRTIISSSTTTLSDVMFVTTANSLDMPQPLLDRMEIIRLEGYTEDEKVEIAKRHLIPKQMEAHGLKEGELDLQRRGAARILRYYTREAGVRTLERELAKVARKALRQILEGKIEKRHVTADNLTTISASAASATGSARKRTRSARLPASPGPKSAASC